MSNSRKKLITKIIAHTILILGAVIMLVPFFWMLSSSFKTLGEVFVFSADPVRRAAGVGKLYTDFQQV